VSALTDVIREKMQEFILTHGRTPNSEEAKRVGEEAFLALSAEDVLEEREQMSAKVEWIEA
jgi:hypothetical protein